MTITPQQQVTADANAMQQARDSLNDANNVVTASALTAPQKIKVHTALAAVAGILQTAEAVAKAWVTANPPPVTPPPTPPSSHLFGINSIDDQMWTNPASYPITQLKAIGAKVCRASLIMDNGSWDGYDGAMTYPLTLKARGNVESWTKAMSSNGIQPVIVCTFKTLQDTPTMVAAMGTLAADNPGVIWEWGNELEYEAPTISIPGYVAQLIAVTAAIHAADRTAKVGHAPVENITSGQQGMNQMESYLAAGLLHSGIDITSFHCYDDTPTIVEALIPPWLAQLKKWGINLTPYLTECGWNSTDVSQAVQASYCQALMASSVVQGLAMALPYNLVDDDTRDWGWTSAGYVPKPVYTAFATRS